MAKLRAAVLAAGRGVRMGGRMPKTLLPIGDSEPLLHYILAGLSEAGVEDLMVVTGFEPGQIQEYVNSRWDEAKVTYVFNARYASWGNFHTVRMAIEQSPGMDLMCVNSDVIVHPDVYRRVAGTPGDLVLAVQKRQPHRLDQEDMRVHLEAGRVRGISKSLPMALSHGEFAGVSLIRPPAALQYLGVATNLEWRSATTLYYEDIYGTILPEIDARAALVPGDQYAEVDTPDDVQAASQVIEANADAWGTREAAAPSA